MGNFSISLDPQCRLAECGEQRWVVVIRTINGPRRCCRPSLRIARKMATIGGWFPAVAHEVNIRWRPILGFTTCFCWRIPSCRLGGEGKILPNYLAGRTAADERHPCRFAEFPRAEARCTTRNSLPGEQLCCGRRSSCGAMIFAIMGFEGW